MGASHRILVSHPTGNQNVRNVLRAFADEGVLHVFATTIGFSQSSARLLEHIGRPGLELARRSYDISPSQLISFPRTEVLRLLAQTIGLNRGISFSRFVPSTDQVYLRLDRDASEYLSRNLPKITHVYAYEDGASLTFRVARARGVATIYDLPIAYWETARRLYEEELDRYPEWKSTMPGLFDSETKNSRKQEEVENADLIICPSNFVSKSLPIRFRRKSIVAPFGSPSIYGERKQREDRKSGNLQVLFVGSMTQRKGLADLFAAMRLLNRSDVTLTVLGHPLEDFMFYRSHYPEFRHITPRAHTEVLRVMRNSDVLVLPSIVEGRALVVQEALSCGLIVVVTENTGASDMVDEGKNGYVIPIRSPESIASRLEFLAENRGRLDEMSRASLSSALRQTWSMYRAAVSTAVSSLE